MGFNPPIDRIFLYLLLYNRFVLREYSLSPLTAEEVVDELVRNPRILNFSL